MWTNLHQVSRQTGWPRNRNLTRSASTVSVRTSWNTESQCCSWDTLQTMDSVHWCQASSNTPLWKCSRHRYWQHDEATGAATVSSPLKSGGEPSPDDKSGGEPGPVGDKSGGEPGEVAMATTTNPAGCAV